MEVAVIDLEALRNELHILSVCPCGCFRPRQRSDWGNSYAIDASPLFVDQLRLF